jgi:hypothetical protein
MQEKRKILHKAKKGEAIPYRIKLGQRRNHSVVLHRDYHTWSRQQEERHVEEMNTEAQEMCMEEGGGKDTGMDT